MHYQHFVDNEPTAAHPDPLPANAYDHRLATPARKRPAARAFDQPSIKKRVIEGDGVASCTDFLVQAGDILEACDGLLLLLGSSHLSTISMTPPQMPSPIAH